MRKFCAALLVAGLVGFVGCNKSETGGGGTGGAKSETFKLSGPLTSTAIKQGETQAIKIKVDRGKDFKEDVQLSVPNPPKGVTVEPVDVKASQKEDAEIRVKVGMDAPLGESTLAVVGKPAKGSPTSLDVKIKVQEAKEPTKEGAKKDGDKKDNGKEK
jgi:hypothetical protein